MSEPLTTKTLKEQQAGRLETAADWFTDCKTLTLERLPTGFIAALRAGALALRAHQTPAWQPIASAPKDGTMFVGLRANRVEVFRRVRAPSGDYWNCATECRLTSSERETQPTLWTPLPSLPVEDPR